MKHCSYCGKEYGDEAAFCSIDGQPLGVEPPQPRMPPKPLISSAKLHCLVSLAAVFGAFFGWNLWLASGGWERREHWGEGILWGVSVVVGLWGAFDAIQLDRLSSWVTLASLLLGAVHILSAMLFLLFMKMLAYGGPRP